MQIVKKPSDEGRNKSEDKYKINVGDKNVKSMKEKEGNLIINIIFLFLFFLHNIINMIIMDKLI